MDIMHKERRRIKGEGHSMIKTQNTALFPPDSSEKKKI